MYRVSKVFNSRDGKLEVDSREYGITQEGVDLLGDAKPHMGAATHIFAKTVGGPSNSIRFFTRNEALSFEQDEKPETGWAVYNIEHGSGYAPERGESGWWNVQVANAPSEVYEGVGLPHSWHVSTFIIFEWVEGGVIEPEIPEEGPEIPENPNPNKILKLEFSISTPSYAAAVRLYTDGTYEMDEING